jgi:hypothetical protein
MTSGCVLFGSPTGQLHKYGKQLMRVGTPIIKFKYSFRKEKAIMPDNNTIFVLTREDVVNCAREMDIPEDAITDDVLALVKKGVEWGLECWSEVVKEAINMTLKS